MPDDRQALADRLTLQQRAQQIYGLDPNIVRRGTILPYGKTASGETEWAIPEIGVDLLKSALLPGHVLQGGTYTPQDAMNFTLDYALPATMRAPIRAPKYKGIETYHGSPHKFEKFSDEAIGTGEGAQAYGHGHYLAENPEVAGTYQRAGMPMYRGAAAERMARRALEETGDKAKALAQLNRMAADVEGPNRQLIYDAINNFDELIGSRPGHIYKTRITAKPDELLDWDKPLSEQSPKVQKALRSIHDFPADRAGSTIYIDAGLKAGGVGRDVHAAATTALKKVGIKGIRYKDAMSRGAEGGTSNYVVFDPQDLKITHIDDNAIRSKKLAERLKELLN